MTLREYLQLQAELSEQTVESLPPESRKYWEGRQRAFLDALEMVDKFFPHDDDDVAGTARSRR